MNSPNNTQIRIFNSILNRKNLRDNKKEIVFEYTEGRTESTKEMTSDEIQKFIDFHNQTSNISQKRNARPFRKTAFDYEQQEGNNMRRMIIGICREAFDMNTDDGKADMKRIYSCVEKLGYLKKGLNSYTYKELTTLVTQFERIGESTLKAKARKNRKDWKVSVFDDDGNEIEFDVTEFMTKTN
ncbi:hypothetical protein V9L05_19895 [Bernardetia sp. Wsw4-3y2]|uniref:hypothetical protein n=1 Tax=Bernardetia sp. Wsw4-3y2 TaxID=3127471 RepID=UPI0030CED8E2